MKKQPVEKLINRHPSFTQADALAAICAPLRELGIVYFTHVHTNQKNELTALGNHPVFHEIYLKKAYYEFDYHQAELPQGEHYILWDFLPVSRLAEPRKEDFNACKMGHTFSIINQTASGKECYHFAAQLGDDAINGRYLTMLGVLKQFVSYFKDKTLSNPELVRAYEMKIPLSQYAFTLNNQEQISSVKELIQSDRCYQLVNNQYLTPRELECLFLLSQGKTFEEAAIVLNISARTVKAHIDSVKLKTGSQNLFQLGAHFSRLMQHRS